MTETTPLVSDRQARLVHRLASTFYGLAATAAVIGQTWVAVDHLPWPDGMSVVWRVAATAPFAVVLELLAVVLAVMSDYRLRLGERAVGIRAFSATVAIVATGVIVLGHREDIYLAAGFGTLSAAAYLLALVHMAARRRDALRAAGQLAQVAPAYGLYRRLRHPVLTARASELARERGLGLYESLRAAELELRAARRRPAIAAAVESAIRASHDDPRMAEIAVSTLDLDRIAAELELQADYAGWAARLAPAVTAPQADVSAPEDESPLYVPGAWVTHSGDSPARLVTHSGESPESPVAIADSPAPTSSDSPGDSPESAGKSAGGTSQRVTHSGDSPRSVPAELIERARGVSDDPEVRMAWLWHATEGRASGRELARAGDVSASTGIRRASQWRSQPPADPRR